MITFDELVHDVLQFVSHKLDMPTEELDIDIEFAGNGIDSVCVLQLAQYVEVRHDVKFIGIELSSVISIKDLAELVLQKLAD